MKSSLTLLLGGVMLAATAHAAPLARSLSAIPEGADLVPVSKFHAVPTALVPTIPSSGLVFTPASKASIERARAARSASAAANAQGRVLADNVTLIAQSGANNFNLIPRFYILPHQSTTKTADFISFNQSGYPPCTYNGGGVYNPDNDTFSGLFCNYDSETIMYFETVLNDCSVDMSVYYRTDLSEVGLTALAVTRDPVSGKAYGSFYKDDGSFAVWGEVDYRNRVRTVIKDTPVPIVEIEGELYYDFTDSEAIQLLGVTRNGQYYGIRANGTLVKIDKGTGEQTQIGDTGLRMLRTEGSTACINQRNNTMIVSYVPADASCTYLYEIDLGTAEKTVLATYPATFFYNMFMIPMAAAEKAPAAPVLTVTAPEGTMTAHYTITLPTTLFDGTPINGSVDWEISERGEVLFEGRNMAGSTISGDLVLSSSGMKTFVGQAKNDEGYSPKSVVEIFIGKGTPAAPAAVTASYANGTMTLTWDAVDTAADGGYLVPDEVTYDIAEDGVLLAKDLTATTYSFAVPYPETLSVYKYTVTANYAGHHSASMVSNEVKIGPVALPYIAQLNSQENFDASNLSILDNNGDGTTWKYTSNAFGVNYNSSLQMDDWLFTPEVKLEAGKVYEVKVRTWCNGYTERLEVKYGKESTPEAMTGEVIPATIVNWRDTDKKYLSGLILPEEECIVHIGVHGCSDADQYYLYLDEIQIGRGIPATAPAAPGSIALSANVTGLLACNVAVEAPSLSSLGETITEKVTINLRRNGELIRTMPAVPGATVAYKDETIPVKGTYTYSASAVNADGEEGPEISKDVYVGPTALIASKRCEFYETNQPGTVTVIWDPVTTDVDGNNVASSQVTYMVYDAETMEEMLPERTANLRATFKALDDPNKQKFCQFVVAAFNRDQEPTTRNMKESNYAPVGKAYPLPVRYTDLASFENYLMAVVLGDEYYYGTKFGIYDSTSFDGITGQDDDIFYGFTNTTVRGYGELLTGKLDLTKVARPELSFRIWKQNPNDDNELAVSVIADDKETTLNSKISTDDFPVNGWNMVRISLAEFAGKNVQIHFVSTPDRKMMPHLFDNITIKDAPAVDIEVNNITAPKKVAIGEEFDINVELTNLGYDTAREFNVNLFRNGNLVDTQSVAALDSEDAITVIFENVIGHFDDDTTEATYYAEVEAASDGDAANNRSKNLTIVCKQSTLPQVTDLDADITDEGVKLTWSTYQLPGEDEVISVSEDFEDQPSWAKEIKDWTFLDLDGRPLGQHDFPMPGVIVRETCASFIVMDQEEYGYADFTAHSGVKNLVSMYCVYGEDTHDWAISPRLSCVDDNTLSLWARSASSFKAVFKIMATTVEGSINPDDYEDISEDITVGPTWTEFEFNLDLSYKHFAIVSKSPAPSTLFIDDVTFNAPALDYAPTLAGYDVYRNGVKIGETDGTGEFVDTEAPMGYHKYHVVARYAEGYSELSNPAEIEVEDAGINGAYADQLPVVQVEGSYIVVSQVTPADVITISAIDGKLIYTGVGNTRYPAAPAFYLVTVNKNVYKVVVR